MGAPQTLPADFQGWDKAPATLPADFDKWDQPAAAPSGFWDKLQQKLPGTADTGLKGAVSHIQDTLNFLKSTYDVSAPGIAQQVYKKLSGQPNELKQLPGKMVTAFALGDEPEGNLETEVRPSAEPAPSSPAAAAAPQPSSVLSRAGEVVKRRLAHMIPGVKAAKDAAYILGGDTPKAPTPAPAEVPPTWGAGRYGTPVDQWGQRIPETPVYPGAPQPEHPGEFPGALQPETPSQELLQGNALLRGPRTVVDPAAGLETIPVRPGQAGSMAESVSEPPAAAAPATPPLGSTNGVPRTLSGESALRQVIPGNKADLMKIAKSRGISTSQAAQLVPAAASKMLIDKIVDDFSPEELENVRSQYIEETRMGHSVPQISETLEKAGLSKTEAADRAQEAWNVMKKQTYFPDLQIPMKELIRSQQTMQMARGAIKTNPMPETGALGTFADALKKTTAQPARTVVIDPATGQPEFSDVLAAKQPQVPASPEQGVDLMQQSIRQANARRALKKIKPQ